MTVIQHEACAREEWRPGVVTRMRVAAQSGAAQLTIFEQWIAPGSGAPDHRHAVEEVLCVLAGCAEVHVGAERYVVEAGTSVLVPAGQRHGFRNVGTDELHVLSTLAAPIFEAVYADAGEATRRWLPVDVAGA
jgi:quercetin dioxygenase-like cupin family protein